MNDKNELGRIIWETSQSDEATISATGANIVADAILTAGYRKLPRILGALAAVLAVADRLDASNQCEDREIAEDIRAATAKALEG